MGKKHQEDVDEDGIAAGVSVCEEFQKKLDKKAKGDSLGRVALRLIQALDAKRADKADHGTRLKAGGLIVDIFGAKTPEKVEHSGGLTVVVRNYKDAE